MTAQNVHGAEAVPKQGRLVLVTSDNLPAMIREAIRDARPPRCTGATKTTDAWWDRYQTMEENN